jgi:hypothetical protein
LGEETRSMARCTWSSRGKTSLGSLGLPSGTRWAKRKPEAGSERMPVLRPN